MVLCYHFSVHLMRQWRMQLMLAEGRNQSQFIHLLIGQNFQYMSSVDRVINLLILQKLLHTFIADSCSTIFKLSKNNFFPFVKLYSSHNLVQLWVTVIPLVNHFLCLLLFLKRIYCLFCINYLLLSNFIFYFFYKYICTCTMIINVNSYWHNAASC